MTTDTANTRAGSEALGPNPDLKSLDRLVGTWQLEGDALGSVTYEWMEGSFFLIQHFDITLYGHNVKGIEIIGHLRPFDKAPGKDIGSRAYDNTGNTLDYVYEIERDTLTIWGGEKGSPAYYKGTFSDEGNTNAGAWVYPGGGGYKSTMRRVQ